MNISEPWLILLVATIIGIVGFFIRQFFFSKKVGSNSQKQKGGDEAEMYQAGGDMHVDKSKKD